MSKVTIRTKLGSVSAAQIALSVAIIQSANEVFALKPELKATQVITPENEITVVSKVKDGITVEYTGREYKSAPVARVATQAPAPAPLVAPAVEEQAEDHQSEAYATTEE